MPKPVRGLVLMSGGLDSRLAVCLLREQGISVTGLSFESPFYDAARARSAAALLGVPLMVEDFTAGILAILEHPRHGFGSGLNPCIDCHAAMLRRAGQRMEAEGFHLVATGEVLNQRPMSQTRRSLGIVAADSGYDGWILRPLSARLLPETEPERRGWVDRSRLLDLNGRGRKPQYDLAARLGVTDYPGPAGGCRLTEPNYSARLRDLRAHEGLADLNAIELLRVGRHFRFGPAVKLIVGRDETDNAALVKRRGPHHLLLQPLDAAGPTALLDGRATESEIETAARICARYSDSPAGQAARIEVMAGEGRRVLQVPKGTEDEIERLRIQQARRGRA